MKVVVIGGGPAGMLASIAAAQNDNKVILLEKMHSLGRKLLITGKGRCNITSSLNISDFIQNIPGNGKFLYSSFRNYTNLDIINLLKKHGVKVKNERGNRVFPVSDKSKDVLQALIEELRLLNVQIRTDAKVKEIITNNSKIAVGVILESGEKIIADKVILATGGMSYPATGSTGDGYKIAEKSPDRFHATSPFNIETGELKKEKKADYSKIFGEKLVKLARENEKIVAVTASMKDGTGLREFQKEFPKRFFDVGIAEQHAITMSAGMAKEGMIPVIPIYSSFYQRAYDQVIHDVAMQNLPVIMCVDRAGCVGADGETHQGTLDMAFFRLVPNLTIIAPKDFKELEDMLEFAVKLNKPVIIRYPRGGEDSKVKFERHENIELGKAEVLKKIIDEEKSNKTKILQKIGDKVFNNKTQRERVTIIAIGKMVARAMDIGQRLQEKMDVEVINARFLKPLDDNTIIESIKKTKNVITIEDGTIINGLATAVKEVIVNNNLQGVKIKSYAYPDEFIKHGSVDELEKIYGLDEENIINGVNKS